MDFRIKQSGAIVTEAAFRAMFETTSLPNDITDEVAGEYGADKIIQVPAPTLGKFQVSSVDVQLIGNDWTQVWTVSNLPVAEIQAQLQTAATQKRWEAETAGITIGGVTVGTTIEDQNRINSVVANARRAGVTSVDFKGQNGWATLTIDQVEGIADAIALHVQASFSAEKAHSEAIAALSTVADLVAYDVTVGWPA